VFRNARPLFRTRWERNARRHDPGTPTATQPFVGRKRGLALAGTNPNTDYLRKQEVRRI
jgi:hypothetical protein